MALPPLHVVMKDVLAGAGSGGDGAPELLATVPQHPVDGSRGAVDAAQGIADAHGFELLLVEEPTKFVFAVEHGAVCTRPAGGS
eukprot:9684584-Heterocapsa_arctica.AAC.1